jgi:hypothetical protein
MIHSNRNCEYLCLVRCASKRTPLECLNLGVILLLTMFDVGLCKIIKLYIHSCENKYNWMIKSVKIIHFLWQFHISSNVFFPYRNKIRYIIILICFLVCYKVAFFSHLQQQCFLKCMVIYSNCCRKEVCWPTSYFGKRMVNKQY